MTYEQFCVEYHNLFRLMMRYKPDEIGSSLYAEKMADLSDKYPEYMERFDEQFA